MSPSPSNHHHHGDSAKPKNILPILLALTMATVNESLAGNMLMPFVGNLISSVTGEPLEDSGFLSGIIVASFHAGQMCSGTKWGQLGDRIGRRPVIFAGLTASLVTQVLFGLSPTIWMLCVTRFCQGLGNGNMATIKTVVAEISTKENEAMAFSFLTFSWGIGTLAGQSIGGLLYDPVKTWGLFSGETSSGFKGFIKTVLVKFPALAPCIFAALYGLISLLVLSKYLIETNTRITNKNNNGEDLAPSRKSNNNYGCCCCGWICCCCCGGSSHQNNLQDDDDDEGQNISSSSAITHEVIVNNDKAKRRSTTLQEDDDDEVANGEEEVVLSSTTEMKEIVTSAFENRNENNDHENKLTFLKKEELEKNHHRNDEEEEQEEYDENPASPGEPHQRKPVTTPKEEDGTAAVVASHQQQQNAEEEFDFGERIGFKGALSVLRIRVVMISYMLLASHDIAYVECLPLLAILAVSTGGFNLSVAQLGLLNSALGVTQIASNVIYPIAYKRWGKKLFPAAAAAVAVFNIATPLLHLVAGYPAAVFFPIVIALMVVRQLNISAMYTTISIMLKDAAPKRYIGELMGLTQSAASFVRLITPALAAPFFAFSATHEWPLAKPFNVTLIFGVCGLLSFASAVYTAKTMGSGQESGNNVVVVRNESGSTTTTTTSLSEEKIVRVDEKTKKKKSDKKKKQQEISDADNNCLVDDDDDGNGNVKSSSGENVAIRDSSPTMSSGVVASSIQREEELEEE